MISYKNEARYQTIFRELDAYFETVLIGLWKGQGKGLAVTKDDLKAINMVTSNVKQDVVRLLIHTELKGC